VLFTLAGALSLAACGRTNGSAEPRPDPERVWEELLAAEAAGDEATVRRLLEAWPGTDDDPPDEREQMLLTWRLLERLSRGATEGARGDLALLRARHAGEGRMRSGRTVRADLLEAAACSQSLDAARALAEGPTPDVRAARAALAFAQELADGCAPEEAARVRGLATWVTAEEARELVQALRPEGGREAAASAAVLAVADDFTLGEPVFSGVLDRWGRQARAAGLSVAVLGCLRGQVRVGMRRVPAQSREDEESALRERARALGLEVVGFCVEEALEAGLGLDPLDAVLWLAGADGRVVARLSGRNPDPREVEAAFQRLVTR
jgi:hypothetical protein